MAYLGKTIERDGDTYRRVLTTNSREKADDKADEMESRDPDHVECIVVPGQDFAREEMYAVYCRRS